MHVELGLDQISNAGKYLALVSASYSAKDEMQGTWESLAPMRMHYERVITAVAFMAQFFSEEKRGVEFPWRHEKPFEEKEMEKRGPD